MTSPKRPPRRPRRRRPTPNERGRTRFLDGAFDAVFAWNTGSGVDSWNTGAEALYGFPATDAIGKIGHDLLKTQLPVERAALDSALRRSGHWEGELRHTTRDQREVWVESRMLVLSRSRGQSRILEADRDITARKLAEEWLRAASQFSRQVIDSVREGITVLDQNLRCVVFNPYMEELTGIRSAQMVGAHPAELDRATYDAGLGAILQRALKGEFVQRDAVKMMRVGDGETRWVTDAFTPLRAADGRVLGVIITARDITGRRLLEAQLRQAQKMEVVGQLAGGLAHDFNNLLTAILGYSWFLNQGLRDPEHRRDVQEIIKTANRATTLTRQLLTFSRQDTIEPQLIDLNTLVRDVDRLLKRLLGGDIDFRTSLAPDLAPVRGDAGQIEQVLMNLAVNARDAMPGGGRIEITTANVDVADDEARQRAAPASGRHVCLQVRDTGTGMDEHTQARLFEPFFSTKGPKGTGLGLATVYGIVGRSGGHITVESALGEGTTFRIYLPAAEGVPTDAETAAGGAALVGGTESILLVEDDDPVRALERMILERAGYRVFEAANMSDAEAVHADIGAVNVLVTDVMMPGGNGTELFARLSRVDPAMRVLYLSGSPEPLANLERGGEAPGRGVLRKPFSADILVKKVREVLDA